MRIKGFDKNLCCRGMQYEVGKEYTTNAKGLTCDDLCSNKVLHYCDDIQKVNNFYPCADNDNRYCEIEVLGEEVTDGYKYGSNHIKIVREIVGEELNALKGHINGNTGLFNIGKCNSGNWNSGYYNSGNRNNGTLNSGYRNDGNWNSGCGNVGDCNSGSNNRGKYNSGFFNHGERNSGYRNIGGYNSGERNIGYYNSGLFNYCDRSNGVFCNKNDDNIRIFNIPSGMSYDEFLASKYYTAIESSPFVLNEWVEYTDEEKKESERKALDECYLKEYNYKDACKNWWNNMSEENKEIIKSIPNFDAEIFEYITGIKI